MAKLTSTQTRFRARAGSLAALLALAWAAPAGADRLWVSTLQQPGGAQILSFDAATGQVQGLFAQLPAGESAYGMACTATGELLVAQQFQERVLRVDGTTGESLGTFWSSAVPVTPTGIVRAPDGNLLVTMVLSRSIEELDGMTGAWVRTFAQLGDGEDPFSLAWGPDGTLHVAVGWFAGTAVVAFDAAGVRLGKSDVLPGGGRGVAVAPGGRVFVSKVYSPPLVYGFDFDRSTGTYVQAGPVFEGGGHGLRVGADGLLYVAGTDAVLAFDTATGSLVRSLPTGTSGVGLAELFFGSDAGPCPSPRPGPVAAWGFDEAAGTAVLDGSGFGHDGAIVGAVERVAGVAGGALRLDGASGFVRVPDAAGLSPAGAMTVAALVRPADSSVARAIVSKWNDTARDWSYILKEEGNSLRVELSRGNHHDLADLSGAAPIPPGRWVHVAATFDGLTARLYVDGVESSRSFAVGAIAPSATDLLIGAVNLDPASGTAQEIFSGDLDEVRLYDRALPPAELAALADVVPPTTTAALAGTPGTNGWWRSAVTVSLAAADAVSGVREIRYRVDGGAEVVVPGSVASLGVTTAGRHTVTYFAVDAGGHAEAPRALDIAIDRSAPVVLLATIPSSLKANGRPQEVLVLGGALDLPSGVASVQIAVADRAGNPVASLSGFNRKVTLLGVEGEVYTVTAAVTDRAGNVGTATRQIPVR